MAEEMQLHLEQRTEENIAAGMPPDEARFAARREFGGIEQIKEIARDQRGTTGVEHLVQDFRFGARLLRKQPGFTAVAVLTLAFGIGATTAIFSVVNGVLLRPLDFPAPDQLVLVNEAHPPTVPLTGVSPGAYSSWQQQTAAFSSLAAWSFGPYNLTGAGEPRRIFAQRVTPNYFGTLGVRPDLGRDFRPGEDAAGKDNVVILSHALWLDQFGGRAQVVGQSILLDERPFLVIGVMAPGARWDRRAEIYTLLVTSARDQMNFDARRLQVIGRLKPGVTLAQARGEMATLADRLAEASPATNQGWQVRLMPLLAATVTGVRPLLLSLLGAVGFLLLIACVNVANLLLARATARHREIAVRSALGAGRGRIVRQLLCESLLIAALGGGLGALLAAGGTHLLLAFAPEGLPRLQEISMDGRVLAFTCLLAGITGLGFGLAPALEATRVDAVETLKDGGHGATDGRRRLRLRSVLVVLEVALALILLTGAGLLARSFLRLQRVDPGYQPQGVYMSNIALIPQKYAGDPQRVAFVDQACARLAQLTGIQGVAFTNHSLPLMGNGRYPFTIAGHPAEPAQPAAYYYAVTPDYLRVMGIPVRRGRGITPQDSAGAPRVALINEELARVFFPDSDPLGQHISLGNGPEAWREIVGVVGDVKQNGLGQPTRPQILEPFAQSPSASTSFVVRTTLVPPDLLVDIRDALHTIDPEIPLDGMYPLTAALDRSVAAPRFALFLFGVFAGSALLLAAVGIYGVISYSVTQRTGEIGIRMALGAQRRDVLRLILRQGARMIGAGLLAGLIGALALSQLLAWMLFEVSPHDPLTLAIIVGLLATVAFAACWLPARRATQVDPLVALRCE